MPRNPMLRHLVRVSLGLVATAAIAAPLVTQAQSAERKRVVVGFQQPATASDRAMLESLDARVKLEIAELNAIAVDLPVKAVKKLQANKRVKYVEDDIPMYPMGVRSAGVPLDPNVQEVPYGITMVQADQVPGAHVENRRLCIIDSGYETAHEDLSLNNAKGENLTRSGDWNTDELHHGTHVGGTVSAINNSLGVVGVLPNAEVSLYIVKVFDESGSAPASTIAKAMVICGQHHANIISMSLGGGPSQVQQTAARLLDQKGVLMIAAAGNGGNSAISYPAGFAEVVSVGAVDSQMAWATFSQFNDDVELAAPGVAVRSTVPMGTGIDAAVNAGGQDFVVIGMQDSPNESATAPLADFGLGETIDPAMAGKICLIQRGNITFALKVQNCEASGGLGAIIYNNIPGPLVGTLAGAVTNIPSVGADGNDGAALLAKVGQTTTVSVAVGNYSYFDGTSMATPHVSAVAALVWSYHPDCSATDIRKSLARSAMDLGDPGRDPNFGFGLVQAKDAFVRINALGCGN